MRELARKQRTPAGSYFDSLVLLIVVDKLTECNYRNHETSPLSSHLSPSYDSMIGVPLTCAPQVEVLKAGAGVQSPGQGRHVQPAAHRGVQLQPRHPPPHI